MLQVRGPDLPALILHPKYPKQDSEMFLVCAGRLALDLNNNYDTCQHVFDVGGVC